VPLVRARFAALRSPFVQSLAHVVIFAAVAVALYLPVSPFASSRLPGGGSFDPAGGVWALAWEPYAIGHWLNLFYSNLVDYPKGVNLASNLSMPLLGIIGAPITVLTGPVATFNFLLRFGYFASATTMYFALRSVCSYRTAAFTGGLLFGFGPYLVSQGEQDAHLNFAFGALLPLFVWCVYELFVRRRYRPLRFGLLLGVVAGLQALINPEVLAIFVVVIALAILIVVVVHHSVDRSVLRHVALGLAAALVAFFVIAGDLIWWTLVGHGHLSGPVQSAAHLQTFSTDLIGPLVPTSNLLVAPSALARVADGFVGGNFSENGSYLGIPLLVAVAAAIVLLRREGAIRLATGSAAIAFVLSLGSRLTVDGHRSSIPLPEAAFAHLPLLNNTVPARYAVAVLLFTAVIAAIALDRAIKALANADRRNLSGIGQFRLQRLGLLACCAAIAVTVAPKAPIASPSLGYAPRINSVLREIPAGDVVLTYPYPSSAPFAQPMVWAAERELSFKLIGGYANVRGPGGKGQWWPPLVAPVFVQEFLVSAQYGYPHFYPAPMLRPNKARIAALCEFLRRYSVSDVLFWPAGAQPASAASYFEAALGRPTISDSGTLLWRDAANVCR
jgi:hypothetical protein